MPQPYGRPAPQSGQYTAGPVPRAWAGGQEGHAPVCQAAVQPARSGVVPARPGGAGVSGRLVGYGIMSEDRVAQAGQAPAVSWWAQRASQGQQASPGSYGIIAGGVSAPQNAHRADAAWQSAPPPARGAQGRSGAMGTNAQAPPVVTGVGGPPGGPPPPSGLPLASSDGGSGLEWWEVLGARLGRWRGLRLLRRLQLIVLWPALLIVLVALAVSPLMRASLGAWIGSMWVVVAWFWMARLKTVSWRMVSVVFSLSIPWSVVVAWVSMWMAASAGVDVRSTSAELVVASVVEEVLKLAPVGLLGLLAPGRMRRLLVADWLVLGIASGAGFMAMEEMARRFAYLSGEAGLAGLLDRLLCSGSGSAQLECMGFTTFGPSPFSGAFEAALTYGGHAVVTGLVAVSIGLARHVWWRTGRLRASALRALVRGLCVVVPPWFLWVAIVDHMGRNGSLETVAWWNTHGEAPWAVVGVTSVVTAGGQGRGWMLLALLILGTVCDARVLLHGGYSDSLYEDVGIYEGQPGGGALGAWRWRTLARLPATAQGRWQADGLDAVVAPLLEWRLV